MAQNYFFWINEAVQYLLTSAGDPFLTTGMNWFRWISVAMILWMGFGILWSRGGGFTLGRAFGVLVKIVVCLHLLRFYNIPAPGFDNTLHGYITGAGAALASQIDITMTEKLTERFNDVILGMEVPAWHNVLGAIGAYIHYYFCVFAITGMQMVMVCVIAFGWVAIGILVLFGPIAIPFILVPGREHYFWNWFSSLVQYSFYPVVANAFVFVYGHVMMNFFDFYPPPYDAAKLASMFLVVVGLACSLLFGFYKVPGLTADIFRGSSGHHTMPGIGKWRG